MGTTKSTSSKTDDKKLNMVYVRPSKDDRGNARNLPWCNWARLSSARSCPLERGWNGECLSRRRNQYKTLTTWGTDINA
ncbi:hypothetical protein Tco_0291702 [Tanacetum coccineum]